MIYLLFVNYILLFEIHVKNEYLLSLLLQYHYFHTIFWLYFTYPLSWAIVDIIYIPVILLSERKIFRKEFSQTQTIQEISHAAE